MNCNYCKAELIEIQVVSGKYTGCPYWHCAECSHDHMDDKQSIQWERINMGLDIQKEKQ